MTTPKALMAITECAWDDIRAAADGTEIGVIVIVLHKDDDELVTQLGATVAPDIVRYAIGELHNEWTSGTGRPFRSWPRFKRRKAV